MLERARHLMPDFVRNALRTRGLTAAYESRPAYQRNDYLGWIVRAKRDETKQKRLAQMLDELARGDRYMNMMHRPKAPSRLPSGRSPAKVPAKQNRRSAEQRRKSLRSHYAAKSVR